MSGNLTDVLAVLDGLLDPNSPADWNLFQSDYATWIAGKALDSDQRLAFAKYRAGMQTALTLLRTNLVSFTSAHLTTWREGAGATIYACVPAYTRPNVRYLATEQQLPTVTLSPPNVAWTPVDQIFASTADAVFAITATSPPAAVEKAWMTAYAGAVNDLAKGLK